MIIANQYNHLNAKEYLIVNRNTQYEEIQNSISHIHANSYLKISSAKATLGQIFYDQTELNNAFKQELNRLHWSSKTVHYYGTNEEQTIRDTIGISDKLQQKEKIEKGGFPAYSTNNQIDFQKDRIAVEVQFGKYFSVAYDLHVKHTFFFSRNDIDVGIEIIPTKRLETCMDSGVAWFENEVTNVIREGRTNPPVPVLILGIEPEYLIEKNPISISDDELKNILDTINPKSLEKYKEKFHSLTDVSSSAVEIYNKIARIQRW